MGPESERDGTPADGSIAGNARRFSVVKDDVKQRGMNLHLSIVFDEAEPPEFVQKKANPGSGCPNHIRQGRLRDIGNYGLWLSFLTKISQQQENPRQAFLTGIEELIDEIFLDAKIA